MKTYLLAILATISLFATAQTGKKTSVTQHDWNDYNWVDTCSTRYAIVHTQDGRYGIYDLKKHENITELEYRYLLFPDTENSGDDNETALFYGRKGFKMGTVTVSPDGKVTDQMEDEEELFFTPDSFKTVDKSLNNLVTDLLMQEATSEENEGAFHAEALVMDVETGCVKSWVALEDKSGTGVFEKVRPKRFQVSGNSMRLLLATMALADANLSLEDSVDAKCGIDTIGGFIIRDHNYSLGGYGHTTYKEAFKNHSNIAMARALFLADSTSFRDKLMYVFDNPRAMDAYSVASIYNLMDRESAYTYLALNTGAVVIADDAALTEKQAAMCREILKATLQEDGIGSRWTTDKVDISGEYSLDLYCRPTVYDDNAKELDKYYRGERTKIYRQVTFCGYFPSDNPRYVICVTMNKNNIKCFGKNISNTVNKLAEFLNRTE